MMTLIAGAGPTGLTLAIDLARRGLEVRIVDKATEFFAGSRGDGLQPRTLEVFEDLGVLDAVLAEGRSKLEFRVYLDGKYVMNRRMAEPEEPTPDVPYPNPCMLGQSQTERILRGKLAEFGVHVELGTELLGFEQDADGVTARLSTGETVRATYLVGADGGRSTVRKTLGIPFEGTTDESIRMLLGDVAAEGLDHEYGYWFGKDADPMTGVMLSPLPSTDGLFQFAAPLSEEDSATSLETLQGKIEATGGQGLNTGVQDAYNLGWKLADGSPYLLDTYETERRGVAARVLGLSAELMERYKEGAEDAHERGANTRQLDISYRTTTGKLVTGDRAPDAPVIDAEGKRTRLFDLFRGPHATQLVFGAAAPDEPNAYAVLRPGQTCEGAYVVDTEGHAFAAYNASEGAKVLVRPDGYLG